MRRISVVLGALLAVTCCRALAAAESIPLVFNARCYRIPEWNARLMNASAVFPFFEKRTSTRSLSLRFSTADIRQRIAGYVPALRVSGGPSDSVSVSFFAPTAAELARIRENQKLRASQFHDLWYAEGEWKQRKVEPASASGLFRISFYPGGNSWHLVGRRPDMQARDSHRDPDFWIGTCSVREGTSQASCMLTLEQDGVFMDLETPEPNASLHRQLGKLFSEQLEGWRVACG